MTTCAILVNFHGAIDTANAARSALADWPDLELVVVDNSTDAVEFGTLRSLLPESAKVWAAPVNLGFGSACNAALAQTHADYIFLVNPDVHILPGCIWNLHLALSKNERLAAVAPLQTLDTGLSWRLPPSWFPTPLRAWATELAMHDPAKAKRLSLALRAESVRYWTATEAVSQRALSGGVMLLRRSALGAAEPLFDPQFFMYFEDSDLCHRLKSRGFELAVVPKAQAVHAWRNHPHKNEMMAESAPKYFAKHGGRDNRWLVKQTQLAMQPQPRALLSLPADFPPGGAVVPVPWQAHWLLELSPSPMLSPAIGHLGTGPLVETPGKALAHFEGATVYGRLGPASTLVAADNCEYFEWSVT